MCVRVCVCVCVCVWMWETACVCVSVCLSVCLSLWVFSRFSKTESLCTAAFAVIYSINMHDCRHVVLTYQGYYKAQYYYILNIVIASLSHSLSLSLSLSLSVCFSLELSIYLSLYLSLLIRHRRERFVSRILEGLTRCLNRYESIIKLSCNQCLCNSCCRCFLGVFLLSLFQLEEDLG